ncbi:MAG: antitoxin [Brooklawnia sp.]
MGLLDDLKAAADQHEDKVEQAIDKVGDLIDEKTGGAHAEKVDAAQDFLKDKIGQPQSRPQG